MKIENRKYLKNHPAAAEYVFLFECCRAAFAGTQVRYPDGIRPEVFFEIVQHHKLVPHLYPVLKSHCENVPDAILIRFQQLLKLHNLHILKLSGELARLSKLFAAHDIPWLSIKGPALSMQLYGDVAARQSGDLDILVKKEDLDKSIAIIVEAGYQPDFRYDHFSSSQIKFLRRCYKDEGFRHKSQNIHLELHWSLENDQTSAVNREAFTSKPEEIHMGKHSIRTLPRDINILYLCLHGCRHGWYRLFWLWDVAAILSNITLPKAQEIIDLAKKNKCLQALEQAVALSMTVFSIEIEPFEYMVKSQKTVTNLACGFIISTDPVKMTNFPVRLYYTFHTFSFKFFLVYYFQRWMAYLLQKYKSLHIH